MHNFKLHLGIFLLCLIGSFLIIIWLFDVKKVYDKDEILAIKDEFPIRSIYKHITISFALFIIVEVFFVVIKYLIIQ